MTDQKPTTVYRKVWLPTEIRDVLNGYCQRHDTKPSPLVGQLILGIIEDPAQYEGWAVPPAGPNYISVYVDAELWERGVETAGSYGVHLGAMVRVALAHLLAADDIPWDVSTVRPRNSRIPNRE
jgi:hypothetical protein